MTFAVSAWTGAWTTLGVGVVGDVPSIVISSTFIVFGVLAVVFYARAQKRMGTVKTWQEAYEAEHALRTSAEATAEEREKAVNRQVVEVARLHEQLSMERARPDLTAVMAMLETLTASQERIAKEVNVTFREVMEAQAQHFAERQSVILDGMNTQERTLERIASAVEYLRDTDRRTA